MVHFTVALVVTSALFLIAAQFAAGKGDTFNMVGRWTLYLASGFLLLTLAAGFLAFNSVTHDDTAHIVMKTHRAWALVAATVTLLSALILFRSKDGGRLVVAGVTAAAMLVMVTGYFGAELVYRHGIGVARLPVASDHNHTGGGEHDHDAGVEQDPTESSNHVDGGGHDHGDGVSEKTPVMVANTLHQALTDGDKATVKTLLAGDLLVLEGGHSQTSAKDYMEGHMLSDMAFLAHMTREVKEQTSGNSDRVAWVKTTSSLKGTYKDKEMNLTSTETLVLRRSDTGWKIVFIEWGQQ